MSAKWKKLSSSLFGPEGRIAFQSLEMRWENPFRLLNVELSGIVFLCLQSEKIATNSFRLTLPTVFSGTLLPAGTKDHVCLENLSQGRSQLFYYRAAELVAPLGFPSFCTDHPFSPQSGTALERKSVQNRGRPDLQFCIFSHFHGE